MLKSFKIYTCTNGSLGLHLSRAPWDPYPWVSSIQKESTSYVAGLRVGDCLLELNGNDVLGLKISEIAGLLKNHWINESSNYVSVVIWRKKAKEASDAGVNADVDVEADTDEDEENNAHNINQQSLQKFATCLQHIAQLLECPVCLEVVKPPGWQCCNGHVLCNNCRSRSEKCPVCRVPLGPRGRCLLSDKLFTLLADSFPCDGVRSNKNSPKDRRKCSTEFHNQPKMAIVPKHKQQTTENDGDEVKAKDGKKTEQDFILSSLRMGRRRRTKSKKEETEGNHEEDVDEGQQVNKRVYNATANAIVNVQVKSEGGNNSSSNINIINRKSSQDYSNGVTMTTSVQVPVPVQGAPAMTTTTTLTGHQSGPAQCYCSVCYKPDKVAIVNNVLAATTTTATTVTSTTNKYILRVQTQQQEATLDHSSQLASPHQPRQNYQCPTGKLCCLQQTQNVMPSATATDAVARQQQQMTNNNVSTKQTTHESCGSSAGAAACHNTATKTLHNEWQILTHLTQDHQLAVNQYYAEFGQRIAIRHEALHKSVICLNLRGSDPATQIEKFFVAFIPMTDKAAQAVASTSSNSLDATSAPVTKVATFIWHMNSLLDNSDSSSASTAGNDEEVSNFDAIIENPKTGIKWFGRAHCLTTSWSQIYHKQHFLMHEMQEGRTNNLQYPSADENGDAFVIVIKSK